MRRFLTMVALLLAAECVVAQNPKAVLKSIEEGDKVKSQEKFEKITDKVREKSPAMCHLAEAALLAMPTQTGDDKVRGYQILVDNLSQIRSSEDAEKTFKGLELSLEGVISNIEQESLKHIYTVDNESSYLHYLDIARKGNHPNIVGIEKRLELRRKQDAVESSSVELCSRFLELYPESAYRTEVISHRTNLLYNEAMKSSNEATLEQFIADYPSYGEVDKVKSRLMSMRYKRIFSGDNIDDMKWFVEQYPNHKKMAEIKQQMADLEFPTMEHSCEALEAFIAYYPNVTQMAEAGKLLKVAKASEQGSVKDFVEYLREYGYDGNYSAMVSGLYAVTKRYIITPDITNVKLLHFANEEGLAGYMDFEGNVVIEPKYSAERVSFGEGLYDNFMLSEFTTYRELAITKLNDKWGAINAAGEVVIPFKYGLIAMNENKIHAIANPNKEVYDEDGGDAVGYYCDVYHLDGTLYKSNKLTYFYLGFQPAYRSFINDNGINCGEFLTRNYGLSLDENGNSVLVDRNGQTSRIMWWSDEGVTENIIVAEVPERCFIDLAKDEIIKECPYERVYPMSCGLAMVYDGNKYGFINENLELVLPCKYDANPNMTTRFNCGVMLLNDGKMINTKGEYVSLGEGQISDLHECGQLRYNLPGVFMLINGEEVSIVDTSGKVLGKAPSIDYSYEANYLVDYNGNRIIFKPEQRAEAAEVAEVATETESAESAE